MRGVEPRGVHLVARARPRRRIAQLGGTTSAADEMVALGLALTPQRALGGRVRTFERAFATRIGVRHAFSFRAGRIGLYAVLRALGIGPGDDVLLAVPTNVVVANAIRFTGARPVFVDCHRETMNMDLDAAERSITPATRALVLQHTFGVPVDPVRARALADDHSLSLIEDCVHALGSTFEGRQIGSFGDAAFFSLEETKTISTSMGGMLVTDDDILAEGVRAIAHACRTPSRRETTSALLKFAVYGMLTQPRLYPWSGAAYDRVGHRNPLPVAVDDEERMGRRPQDYLCGYSRAQAVLGLAQLDRLDANIAHRRLISDLYARLLPDVGLDAARVDARAVPSFVRYPVRVRDSEATIRAVAPVAQLGTWFTSVLEEAESPESIGYVLGSCPTAEAVAGRFVNLPTHPRVTPADALAIVAALAAAESAS